MLLQLRCTVLKGKVQYIHESFNIAAQSAQAMAEVSQGIQLLQASVDEENESHFRFLIDSKFVKYVTVAAGLYAAEYMCFAPALISLLPAFPYGDWNDVYVTRNAENGQPYLRGLLKLSFRV